jgi:hypothetical protein
LRNGCLVCPRLRLAGLNAVHEGDEHNPILPSERLSDLQGCVNFFFVSPEAY